jgi:hypothetical protein
MRSVWGTHLSVALLLVIPPTVGGITTWGVSGPWWDSSLVPLALGLFAAWTLLFGSSTAWFEAWALVCGHRMLARGIVVAYLVPTWYVAAFPAGFRLVGDDSPLEGSLLVFEWTTFSLLVLTRAVLVRWMQNWSFPSLSSRRRRGATPPPSQP